MDNTFTTGGYENSLTIGYWWLRNKMIAFHLER